ncbi:hypothetical protein [Nonomuraea sp. NPDC049309]|uniref:hypothetical protein n=1 Tax=Nonomuraea sp. NPDC049309 TaxID=3364350 RepID=UPI0037139FE4
MRSVPPAERTVLLDGEDVPPRPLREHGGEPAASLGLRAGPPHRLAEMCPRGLGAAGSALAAPRAAYGPL